MSYCFDIECAVDCFSIITPALILLGPAIIAAKKQIFKYLMGYVEYVRANMEGIRFIFELGRQQDGFRVGCILTPKFHIHNRFIFIHIPLLKLIKTDATRI